MVALRKALSGSAAPAPVPVPTDADASSEGGEKMMVQCPGCGEVFDANSPEAQVQSDDSASDDSAS